MRPTPTIPDQASGVDQVTLDLFSSEGAPSPAEPDHESAARETRMSGVLLLMLRTEIAALREQLGKAGIEREAALETKLEELEQLERDVRRAARDAGRQPL